VNTFNTVEEYLEALPEDRRETLSAIRTVILENLPEGYEEGIQYNMIGYFVPHSIYPSGYHCDRKQPLPFMHLASMKNHLGFYPFCIYGDSELKKSFLDAHESEGKKVDAGKACIRFKKLTDISLSAIADLVRNATLERFISTYESQIPESKRQKK
jgi:uncharacterized protein YdhG (YjbR/CyaY superfamily)